MVTGTTMDLFQSELIFDSNKLRFHEHVIYDFEDRYHNKSLFGVESQLEMFGKLVEIIYGLQLPEALKAQAILIFAQMFKTLSAQNTASAVLSMDESILGDLYAGIVQGFGEANRLYQLSRFENYRALESKNVTSLLVNHLSDTALFSPNSFPVVIVNLDVIRGESEVVLEQCRRLVAADGQIIVYGSGVYTPDFPHDFLYQLGSQAFVWVLQSPGMYADHAREALMTRIQSANSELYEKIQYVMSIFPLSREDVWFTMMDEAISICNQMESAIAESDRAFDNKDLKFLTNEVKNALLDFKYEAYLDRRHYEFFQSRLLECYNSWVEGLY